MNVTIIKFDCVRHRTCYFRNDARKLHFPLAKIMNINTLRNTKLSLTSMLIMSF